MIKWQNPDVDREELQAVTEVLKSGILTSGPKCVEFERAISKITGAKYTAVVSSGTVALHCALQAMEKLCGVKLDVTVPTFSYIAPANAVVSNGDFLHLVDADLATWNIDVAKLKPAKESPEPYGVLLPVDVGGLPCDYEKLKEFIMFILEDASEAMGASYKGTPCGSIADATVFSFHPSKIVTTGEGGAITTNNRDLYEAILQFRSQGNSKVKAFWEYKHDIIGFNYRMTELQAAVGVEQLKKLPYFLERRRKLVKLYKELLGDVCIYQHVPKAVEHSNWLFAVRLKDWKLRDRLCKYLLSKGIETKVTWKPVHQQPAYSSRRLGVFPVADKIARSIVSLPLNNKTTEVEVETVAEEVKSFIGRHS